MERDAVLNALTKHIDTFNEQIISAIPQKYRKYCFDAFETVSQSQCKTSVGSFGNCVALVGKRLWLADTLYATFFSQIKLKCDLAKAPNQMTSGSWLMSLHFILNHLQLYTFAKQNIRTYLKRESEKKQTSYAIGGMYERLRFTHSRQKQYDSLIKLRRKCSHGCVFILNATFAYFFSFILFLFFFGQTFFHLSPFFRCQTGESHYKVHAIHFRSDMDKKILYENSCKQKKGHALAKTIKKFIYHGRDVVGRLRC